jgi:hypothetical protein
MGLSVTWDYMLHKESSGTLAKDFEFKNSYTRDVCGFELATSHLIRGNSYFYFSILDGNKVTKTIT